MRIPYLAIGVVLGCSSGVSAQSWLLRQSSPPWASANTPVAAFDSQRGVTVVHDVNNGLWEWNGASIVWSVGGAGNYASRSMAFDSQRGVTVMVFANSPSSSPLLTKEWNGMTWTLRNTSAAPPGRTGFAIAYDSTRGKVVLFGGSSPQSGLPMADTWEWDGAVWTPRLSSQWPAARSGHAMAFDSTRGRVVMYGSGAVGGNPFCDTWEWDGSNWFARTPPPPTPYLGSTGMAFDAQRGRVVMFGSEQWTGLLQTWEWDGSTWTRRFTGSAPASSGQAMAYDSIRGRIVMAESSSWGRIWEYFVLPASASPFGTGCGQPTLTIAPAAGSRPLFGSIMDTDVTGAPVGIALMAIGLSRSMVGPFQLPLPLDGFGFTGCWAYHDMALDSGQLCSPSGGALRHSIFIPNIPALMNLPIYFQAMAIAPGANAGGVIASNALELVLGST